MILADQTLNAGRNRDHIRNAFTKHNILLGTNAMLAPAMMLSGSAPTGSTLSLATRKDLMNRLGGAAGARLTVVAARVAGTKAVYAQHAREVSLNALDKRLKGVVAFGQELVTIGDSGGRASILGAIPNAVDTEGEVQSFVRSLLQYDAIDLGSSKKSVRSAVSRQNRGTTHAIKTVAGKKILSRTRFQCGCCSWL